MIEQLIVSWEIKTAANGEKKLPPGYRLCSQSVAGLDFGRKKKKEKKLVKKENKGVRWHKGRLSTFHRAHKRKKSLLQLITAELMKEKRQKEEKILSFSGLRGGGGRRLFHQVHQGCEGE